MDQVVESEQQHHQWDRPCERLHSRPEHDQFFIWPVSLNGGAVRVSGSPFFDQVHECLAARWPGPNRVLEWQLLDCDFILEGFRRGWLLGFGHYRKILVTGGGGLLEREYVFLGCYYLFASDVNNIRRVNHVLAFSHITTTNIL